MDMEFKEFLKKYSSISNKFIDDFFSLYTSESTSQSLVIDIDVVRKWLSVRKDSLTETLRDSYIKDVDYTVQKTEPSFGRPRNHVMLTPDCFKMLCMQSKSKKSVLVRQYFIQVEKTLDMYRNRIMEDLRKTIQVLQNERKPKVYPQRGVIYGLQADKSYPEMIKIGKAKYWKDRERDHNTSRVDGVEVLFIQETDDIDQVESCIKVALKKQQYKTRREIYEIDIDQLKEVFNQCNSLIQMTSSPYFSKLKSKSKSKSKTQKNEGGSSGKTFVLLKRI